MGREGKEERGVCFESSWKPVVSGWPECKTQTPSWGWALWEERRAGMERTFQAPPPPQVLKDKFKGKTQRSSIYLQQYFPLNAQSHVRHCTRATHMVSPADGRQNYWQRILLRLCVAAPARTAFKNCNVLLEKIWKISISYTSVFKWKECFYCCCFCRYYLH